MTIHARLRLVAASVIVIGGTLAARPAGASTGSSAGCSVEEWIGVANAVADHCISLGFDGARISTCENNGDGTFAFTGVCRMLE